MATSAPFALSGPLVCLIMRARISFQVAARFRQPTWLRPPAEFVDPEIVILRKEP